MIAFDESFYDGEWRDDFFVTGEMKRVWAAQMEMLMFIDDICKRHGIQYYADAGTMLGAVRHKGFIPWDDDLDIAMRREDYEKFFAVAREEIQAPLRLENIYHDKEWQEPFMRVVNNDKIDFRKENLERWHGCPWVIGVDIFPIDYLPADPMERDTLLDLYMIIRELISILKEDKESDLVWESVEGVEKMCNVKLDKDNIVSELLKLGDKVVSLYGKNDGSEMAIIVYMDPGKSNICKKEWYEEGITMPFENITIPVPIGYDNILRGKYSNYMVPIRQELHNYPFYAPQKKAWEESLNSGR